MLRSFLKKLSVLLTFWICCHPCTAGAEAVSFDCTECLSEIRTGNPDEIIATCSGIPHDFYVRDATVPMSPVEKRRLIDILTSLGESLSAEGQLKQAVDMWRQAASLADDFLLSDSESLRRSGIHCQLAECLAGLKDTPAAIAEMNRGIDLLDAALATGQQTMGARLSAPWRRSELSDLLLQDGQTSRALALGHDSFREAVRIVGNVSDSPTSGAATVVRCALAWGRAAAKNAEGRIDTGAMNAYGSALPIAQSAADDPTHWSHYDLRLAADLLRAFAIQAQLHHRFKEATQALTRAARLYRDRLHDPYGAVAAGVGIGDATMMVGETTEALHQFDTCLAELQGLPQLSERAEQLSVSLAARRANAFASLDDCQQALLLADEVLSSPSYSAAADAGQGSDGQLTGSGYAWDVKAASLAGLHRDADSIRARSEAVAARQMRHLKNPQDALAMKGLCSSMDNLAVQVSKSDQSKGRVIAARALELARRLTAQAPEWNGAQIQLAYALSTASQVESTGSAEAKAYARAALDVLEHNDQYTRSLPHVCYVECAARACVGDTVKARRLYADLERRGGLSRAGLRALREKYPQALASNEP